MNFQKFNSCPSCNSSGSNVIFDLGNMPPVNDFIEKEKVSSQEKFPLKVNFCSSCSLVHIDSYVNPSLLFKNYLHMSSASNGNRRHLKGVASLINERLDIKPDYKILEIGSNDGTLLKELSEYGAKVIGVDPAENLAHFVDGYNNIEAVTAFFNHEEAKRIKERFGEFDVIVALNVVAHTPEFISMLKGVEILLKPNGQFMMENAYVVETILNGQFDTIYHEHVSNFSLNALVNAYNSVGLRPIDAQIIPTQGTSIRVWCCKDSSNAIAQETVTNILQREKDLGFTEYDRFKAAADKVTLFKEDLRKLLDSKKLQNTKVVGLGAPARGVVVLNYCDIDDSDLAFVIDDTELKQGKCIPGTSIEVSSWERLKEEPVDTFLLLSWNYEKDMLEKLKSFSPSSTVIIPFPELREIQIK